MKNECTRQFDALMDRAFKKFSYGVRYLVLYDPAFQEFLEADIKGRWFTDEVPDLVRVQIVHVIARLEAECQIYERLDGDWDLRKAASA